MMFASASGEDPTSRSVAGRAGGGVTRVNEATVETELEESVR